MAHRPNITPEAIAEVLAEELGVNQNTAKTVANAMKIAIPTLIEEFGSKRIHEVLQKRALDNHLDPEGYWPTLSEMMEKWANHVLEQYRAEKKKEKGDGSEEPPSQFSADVEREKTRAAAVEQFLTLARASSFRSACPYPTRDELHERP